jgi:NADH-quinone oxidoreductase subunit A
MNSPSLIVGYLALFGGLGFLFVFVNLLVGHFVRPSTPSTEKLEVYECGEPTIGSSFVQFDLRFYVVALLFIIFDVEVAFFFPWATVYGKAVQLLDPRVEVQATAMQDKSAEAATGLSSTETDLYRELGIAKQDMPTTHAKSRDTAETLTKVSILDIGVFFAVLLVGFAYVWCRGDLDWVRAVGRERSELSQRGVLSERGPPGAAEDQHVLSI